MSIKVNERNHTLEVSKKFQKQASIFGSVEFEELSRARAMFPNFKVVVPKRKSSENYKGLTIDFMIDYIKSTNDDDNLAELLSMAGKSANAEDKFKAEAYGKIRKWFLETYPQFKVGKNETIKDNIKEINAA